MVAINIGSATTTVFSTTAIQDTNASGAHTFKLWTDSVLYLAGGSFGFQAGGPGSSASWTVDIDGTLTGFANTLGTSLPDYGVILGTQNATTLHKVNVGTEGSIYAEQIGISLNSAADVVNKGVIQANVENPESAGIVFESNPTALGPTKLISVKNEATAELSGGQYAIFNASLATLTVTNAGTIYSEAIPGQDGGAVVSQGTLKLTNNANSQIIGGVSSGWVGSSVVNNGLMFGAIDGDIDATYVNGSGAIDLNRDGDYLDAGETVAGGVNAQLGVAITNTGMIQGEVGVLADSIRGSTSGAIANNQVAIDGSAGRDSVSNSGTAVVYGDLGMGMGNDTINNSGLIAGNVDLGLLDSLDGDLVSSSTVSDGNDSLSNTSTGSIYGSVFAGSGNDTVNNAGFISGRSDVPSVDLGSGDDRLINTGIILGNVNLGAGNDAATISGSLGSTPIASDLYDVVGGDGNDTISITATGIADDVRAGNGSDNVTINGRVDDVWLDRLNPTTDTLQGEGTTVTDGDDRLFIGTTGFVQGSIYLGNGDSVAAAANAADQVLSNAGIIDADLLNDTVAGANVNIAFGTGADSLSNATTGQIFAAGIVMGDGNDTVTNAGRMNIDTNDNMGSLIRTPYLSLGAGADRFVNTGTVGGTITNGSRGLFFSETLGATANVYGSLQLNNTISDPLAYYRVAVDAGDGADVVTSAGRIFGFVDMGVGNDSFLGGVNNDFAIDGQGADTMNMGAGADYLYVRGQVNYDGGDTFVGGDGIDLIHFGSDSVNSGGVHIDLASGRVNYELGTDTLNAQDSITGFEQVRGTNLGDSILGGAGAETLDGGAGADTIAGRGGKDFLIGDDGGDRFVFTLSTDSGKTRATRDVIVDFDVAEVDRIALMFDGNGTLAGGAYNGFDGDLIENADFSGDAGQLRTIIQGGNTIIELDMNGDKRVDFSIELRGIVDLSFTDFTFI